jgi:hypothetical protein
MKSMSKTDTVKTEKSGGSASKMGGLPTIGGPSMKPMEMKSMSKSDSFKTMKIGGSASKMGGFPGGAGSRPTGRGGGSRSRSTSRSMSRRSSSGSSGKSIVMTKTRNIDPEALTGKRGSEYRGK